MSRGPHTSLYLSRCLALRPRPSGTLLHRVPRFRVGVAPAALIAPARLVGAAGVRAALVAVAVGAGRAVVAHVEVGVAPDRPVQSVLRCLILFSIRFEWIHSVRGGSVASAVSGCLPVNFHAHTKTRDLNKHQAQYHRIDPKLSQFGPKSLQKKTVKRQGSRKDEGSA